jgi:hypothetical protein
MAKASNGPKRIFILLTVAPRHGKELFAMNDILRLVPAARVVDGAWLHICNKRFFDGCLDWGLSSCAVVTSEVSGMLT